MHDLYLSYAVYVLLPAVALGRTQVHALVFALAALLAGIVAMRTGEYTQGSGVARCGALLWRLLFYITLHFLLWAAAAGFAGLGSLWYGPFWSSFFRIVDGRLAFRCHVVAMRAGEDMVGPDVAFCALSGPEGLDCD